MKKRYKLGDIVAIPISKEKYAFGKIYKDASIGIYSLISDSEQPVSEITKHSIILYSGVFDTAISNGSWRILGNEPFAHESDSWPPAQYIDDIINPNKYKIYYKGEVNAATKAEIKGLEKQAMRKPEQLVTEINIRMKL